MTDEINDATYFQNEISKLVQEIDKTYDENELKELEKKKYLLELNYEQFLTDIEEG